MPFPLPETASTRRLRQMWDALTNDVGTAITGGGDLQPVALDDAQAARMGAFWFDVASGRPAEVP